MLFQRFLGLFFFFLKVAIWVVIPFGNLVLFLNLFPDFTYVENFWFWIVFALLNIIAFYMLRKPVHWVVSAITVLFED